MATTKHNVSASFVMDIIYRMMKVFRDYCGVLNEESIRKNFVLIYEIIDEIIDYGHPQLVATENIRQYTCLLYTSPSPRDVEESRMPSSA